MENTDKQNGAEVLLQETISKIIENPKSVLTADYDAMCVLIFRLFCKGYLDVAEICVTELALKYGPDKVQADLSDTAKRITEDIIWMSEIEKQWDEKDS